MPSRCCQEPSPPPSDTAEAACDDVLRGRGSDPRVQVSIWYIQVRIWEHFLARYVPYSHMDPLGKHSPHKNKRTQGLRGVCKHHTCPFMLVDANTDEHVI